MTVYKRKNECSGCRACELSCSAKCIKMKPDDEGFIYPIVDEEQCIRCGLCHKVCERLDAKKTDAVIQAYAVKHTDLSVRNKSTSGGVFYGLAREIIDREGVVFGAVFDDEFNVVHVGTDHLGGLEEMLGSKYVQSDTGDTYLEVRDLLALGKWVLYSGTPCQIAGLKSFLNKDYEKLICVSVICHGVPSPAVWRRYLDLKRKEHGEEVVKSVEFRKRIGAEQFFSVSFASGQTEQIQYEQDLYMKGFLQNIYLRASCYECRSKGFDHGQDIILGDYWGVNHYHEGVDDSQGVSAVIISTTKGDALWNNIRGEYDVQETSCEFIMAGNITLNESVELHSQRNRFFYDMISGKELDDCITDCLKKPVSLMERYWYQYPTVLKYLSNKVKGYDVGKFFAKLGCNNIALYGINDLLGLLYDDLLQSNEKINIVNICDRQYYKFLNGYKGTSVIGPDELIRKYHTNEIDCIIICVVISENQIIKDFFAQGCDIDRVFSINSVIFGCGE